MAYRVSYRRTDPLLRSVANGAAYRISFRVNAEDGAFLFTADVDVADVDVTMIFPTTEQRDVSGDVEAVMLHFGIERLEAMLLQGTLRHADSETRRITLTLDDDGIKRVTSAYAAKRCDFQKRDGRDLLCSAGAHRREVALKLIDIPLGRVGLRHVIPTSQPICNKCEVPDVRLLCSHLMHIEVAMANRDSGMRREFREPVCGQNRDEVNDPGNCQVGGHQCWERLVEPEMVEANAVPPLALHEALDFFATTWRAAFGVPLLRVRSLTQVASLVLDCASRSEFESHLSGLADVVKLFEVPDGLLRPDDVLDSATGRGLKKDQTWDRLLSALRRRLDEGGIDAAEYVRAEGAVNNLRAVGQIRNSLQHTGGDTRRVLDAWSRVGLVYPPESWMTAWSQIRSRVVVELRVLREVVQLLLS